MPNWGSAIPGDLLGALPKTEQAHNVIDDLNVIARALRNVYIDNNRDRTATALRRITEARQAIAEQLKQLEQTTTSKQGRTLLRAITTIRPEYFRHTDSYLDLVRAEQFEAAQNMLLTEIRQVQENYLRAMSELLLLKSTRMSSQSTVVIAEITRDINGINQQSGQVGEGSAQVQQNAQGLAELAVQLDNLVKQFKA